MGILTYTPTLTKNSFQVFLKRRDRSLTLKFNVKKKVVSEEKYFANFFNYEKDFRGTFDIYKLLKQC